MKKILILILLNIFVSNIKAMQIISKGGHIFFESKKGIFAFQCPNIRCNNRTWVWPTINERYRQICQICKLNFTLERYEFKKDNCRYRITKYSI